MRTTRVLLTLLAVCVLSRDAAAQTSALRLGRPGPDLHIAPNALGWHYGGLLSTQDFDCLQFGGGFNVGFIVSGYVGYYGDPNSNPIIPKVGDVYYVGVFISNVAACQSAGVQPWLVLPANTYLAISASNPLTCFKNGGQVACSQNPNLGYSLSGAYGYNLGVWPDLKGGNLEIHVPVSTANTTPPLIQVRIDTADGWSNPWITPSVQVPIGTGANLPTITYPTPSTDMITDTTATTHAALSTPSTTGTLYFDIGITTNYDLSTDGAMVPSPGVYNNTTVAWSGLAPGTLYHWRARYNYGAGSTVLGIDQTFTTTGTAVVPAVPVGFSATTVAPTQVTVVWSSVLGATSYEVWRAGPSGPLPLNYTQVGTVNNGGTSFTDTTVTANHSYAYKVRAVNSAGNGPFSPLDVSTTVTFTDDRLVEGVSIIRAAHLAQLRTAVDALRTLANKNPGVYTDPATPGVVVKAIHILELRTQYDDAIGALTGRNSSWATTPVVGGPISFVDFQQLRDRIK